jgi:outer membrane protein OmpA-like peptidoglycan-associated protein
MSMSTTRMARATRSAAWTIALALASAPSLAAAAPSATVSGSADADADAGDPPNDGRRLSARGDTRRNDKWIHRWAPQRNMLELGIYGGVWFPSPHLELFGPDPDLPRFGNQRLKTVAPEIGLRAAYFPLRFLGVEIEGGAMPTRTRDTDARATAWALRGHVVAQLGLWSITPFMLVGTGLVGMQSSAVPQGLGKDQDVAIHFGGGAKVFINRWVMLRLDVRDVVSNRVGVGEGLTSSPEILLGLSFTLRPKKQKRPRPSNGDRDGDRVLDPEDFCPDVFGVQPRGCPQVCVDDNDGDGLTNTEDSCIDDPETRNGFEDGDGCPDEVPPELSDLAGIMEGIQFDTDKDTIKGESKSNLDNAVAVMKKYPTIRVRVVGHTDNQGGYKHNLDLSKRRAEAVERYMTDAGIDTDRIETAGVGPDQPIDTNETADGRARNRRIEFQILEETAAKPAKPPKPREGGRKPAPEPAPATEPPTEPESTPP